MSEDTEREAPEAEAPQAPSQADTPTSPAEAEEVITLEEARKLRKEAASLRKSRAELETKFRELRDSGLSELEKAKKRIEDLEHDQQRAEEERKGRAVERLLAGAQYPDLLLAKVDLAAVELDDEGGVRHGDRLVSRLQGAYPLLWNQGDANGGATGETSGAFDMNAYIRRRAGHR